MSLFFPSYSYKKKIFIETYYVLQNIQSLFMFESKITQVVCPVIKHTDPLMPIGRHPANTMASQGLSWDWWGRSLVQKMGVERRQGNFSQLILQIKHRGSKLQNFVNKKRYQMKKHEKLHINILQTI